MLVCFSVFLLETEFRKLIYNEPVPYMITICLGSEFINNLAHSLVKITMIKIKVAAKNIQSFLIVGEIKIALRVFGNPQIK